jgi:hypothetical protein
MIKYPNQIDWSTEQYVRLLFGFDNIQLRSYAEAESLLHHFLKPIPFDTAERTFNNSPYIMHFRDIPTVIETLLKRDDFEKWRQIRIWRIEEWCGR